MRADPEPPLPAIRRHSMVLSAHSPARIPERTCADSHAEGRGQTEKQAFTKSLYSVAEEAHTDHSKSANTTTLKYLITCKLHHPKSYLSKSTKVLR